MPAFGIITDIELNPIHLHLTIGEGTGHDSFQAFTTIET